MTDQAPRNTAASVHQRLLNRSRQTGEAFQFLLQRYAAERFLYRLGQSAYRDQYVLKGAMLFALWGGSIYRPTRDLDFTGYGSNQANDVLAAFQDICAVPVPDDGLIFDSAALTAEPIRDDTEYHGLRIQFGATLGSARIKMQVDVGFGNAIEPPAYEVQYPTLLDGPAPSIRAYPYEAVVAEKLHTLIVYGELTSRMKDLYDLYTLAGQFPFDGQQLTRSIAATFDRRATPITVVMPVALTPRFFADDARAAQWRAYLQRNHLPGAPADLAQVGERIIAFLAPAWEALAAGSTFANTWRPGSAWEGQRSTPPMAVKLAAPAERTASTANSDTVGGIAKSLVEPLRTVGIRRFKPYPAYKDSDVAWLGKFPAHWEVRRLKRLVEFRGGGTPAKANSDYWQGDIPWVSPKDMKTSVVLDTEDKITSEAVRQSATKLVPAGSVLVVFRSGILVHSIPVAITGREVTLNQDLKALIPVSELTATYLMYLVQGLQRQLLVEWKKEGATVESLELELVANTPTPLPPLPEQRAIAVFLDREAAKIDALVAKKERLIELLQEKHTALIARAVTNGLDPNVPMKDSGIEWLGKIPVHWDVKRVRDIADSLQTGPFGSQLHADDYILGGFPVINPANLRDGQLVPDPDCTVDDATAARLAHHRLLHDDILFARRGELGRCGLATRQQEEWLCGTGCLRLRIRVALVRPRFLLHFLSTSGVHDWLQLQSVGSTMQNLNTSIIGRIPIALPMPAEQEAIASYVDRESAKIDALIGKVREGVERLKESRTALISAAVTGKIDVRDEVTEP